MMYRAILENKQISLEFNGKFVFRVPATKANLALMSDIVDLGNQCRMPLDVMCKAVAAEVGINA